VVPTGSDVAIVSDNCTIDISRTIGSLIVRPGFTASINTGLTLQVNDVIDVMGHLSCSGTPNIISTARKNNINSLSPASSSFLYSGSNQNVPGGPYFNLTIYGSGVKSTTSNTIVNRNLEIGTGVGPSGFLELGPYDLSVFGNTVIGANAFGVLSKSKFGNLLFVGSFANGNAPASVRFSDGNPNVEFRSGIITANSNPALNTIFSGTGTWTFTSPTQTLQGWASIFPLNLDANLLISSSAILNIFGGYNISNPVNGANPSSSLVMLANSALTFTTEKALVNSMTTGSFNFVSSSNTIGIGGNYSATIPARFNTFRDLAISGTGTKTLSTSSYVSGSLSFGIPAFLECGSQDLIVSGSFIGISNPSVTFSKTGSGNLKFIGPVNFNNANFKLDGNPNVEFHNGLTLQIFPQQFSSGLGQWKFMTSNQNINFGTVIGTVSSSILISGPITVTNLGVFTITRNINGDNALSKFVNGNGSALYVNTTSSIMSTGIFDITTNANTIGYIMTSSYTIPYTNLYSLYYQGIGAKYLSGNTYISGGLSSFGTSDLDLLTYDCTISGSTVLGGLAKLSKSGTGNVLFIGNVSFNDSTINFTGNPNVEIRNGLNMLIYDYQMISGNGTWKFTTNNQNMFFSISNTKFDCNFLISGPITVTNTSTALLIFSGSINGDNANSKLVMSTNSNTHYANTATPMSTGILDVTSSLGTTFVYASGSQNVKGGTYRNLTFLNGLKTLQGNVSVLGTFSTGSGATSGSISLNGFTLTNP
jgi:hypothetical protein